MLEELSISLINGLDGFNIDNEVINEVIDIDLTSDVDELEYETVKDSPFFDAIWYKNNFLKNSHKDPVLHYLKIGWKLKLPASLHFSSYYYLESMLRNNLTLTNPIVHYENNKEKNLDVKSFQYELIAKSNCFDKKWYAENFLNEKDKNKDPIAHYLANSKLINVTPNKTFNPKVYYMFNPDVFDSPYDAFYHYLIKKSKLGEEFDGKYSDIYYQYETIKNSKLFDVSWYEKRFLDGNFLEIDPIVHYLKNSKIKDIAPSMNFSSKCYYDDYQDVKNSPYDALFHYIMWGKSEGRYARNYNYQIIKYSHFFNADDYIRCNDLAKDTDPVQHYLYNHKDVSFVSHNFDSEAYLESYNDVYLSNVPALLHYHLYGMREGRRKGVYPINSCKYEYISQKKVKLKTRRALIFAGFSSDGVIDDYKIYLIKELSKFVDCIYLVYDSPIIPDHDSFMAIKDNLSYALFEKHHMYDFGSYKIAFDKFRNSEYFNQFDQILLANDSIIGPVGNLSNFFEYSDKSDADVVGLVANNCGFRDALSSAWSKLSFHIQSYFVVLKKRFFTSTSFFNFIENVKKEEFKKNIVINYEMGLSKCALTNGFKIDTFFKSNAFINPSANDCYNLLNQAFFLKTSQLASPRYNESDFNLIFKKNHYPFRICDKKIFSFSEASGLRSGVNFVLRNLVEIVNIHKSSEFYYFLVFDYSNFDGNLKLNVFNVDNCCHSLFDRVDEDICQYNSLKHELLEGVRNKDLALYRIDANVIDAIERGIIFFTNDNNTINLSYVNNRQGTHKKNDIEYNFFTKIRKCFLFFTRKIDIYKKFLQRIDVNPIKLDKSLSAYYEQKRFYILFSEKGDLKSDNAFELYSYFRLNKSILSDYVFYVTTEVAYNLEKNPILKQNMVIRNSQKHYDLFLKMAIGIYSFDMAFLIPNSVSEYLLSMLYKHQSYIMISHGYSGGYNNTAAVGSLYYGSSDLVISCSDYEVNKFKSMGYPKVMLLGYPRFDKWNNDSDKALNEVTFFFTFRRSLLGISLEDLVNSNYLKNIEMILRRFTNEFPNIHINYIFHNALSKPFKEFLGGVILSINESIDLIDNYDNDIFNKVLSSSKFVITDYSSAGFDMTYNSNKVVFFYVNPDFLVGHYSLSSTFMEQAQLANIRVARTVDELVHCFSDTVKSVNINDVSNKLFKYNDFNNSRRCADAVMGMMINNIVK